MTGRIVAACVLLVGAGTAYAQVSDADDPTAVQQYQSDGVTVIPIGGTSTSTTVVFSANVTGTNTTASYQLRIELRTTSSGFTGSWTHSAGSYVPYPGGTSTITVSGLTPGQTYHWQARNYAT